MLACERPWLRSLQPHHGRPWRYPFPSCARYARYARYAQSHKWPGLQGRSRDGKAKLRSSRSEAKAQLLKYLGCFTGSGNAADVRTLISDLEQLSTELPSSLAGDWTLIGRTGHNWRIFQGHKCIVEDYTLCSLL